LEPAAQIGQLAADYIPDKREVYPEVFMDQLVTHPCDLAPRHAWLLAARSLRDPLDRLADDLDIADDCILRLGV
jgi:hypothetical protein